MQQLDPLIQYLHWDRILLRCSAYQGNIVRVNKKEYQWIQMDSYVMYEEIDMFGGFVIIKNVY